jgi:hypothetical protein
MNEHESTQLENNLRYAESRHPVEFLEPVPPDDDSIQRACEVVSRVFIWIADGGTLEQIGLRSTVVLYCVRSDLIGGATLEEIGLRAGCSRQAVENLVTDFCHTIGWR